jgi:L-lactate dehydrogenase complex protein LldG
MSLLERNAAARDAVLGRVREALKLEPQNRAQAVESANSYLRRNPLGPTPAFTSTVVQRFIDWSIKQASTVDRVAHERDIPAAVARYCDQITTPREIVTWPEFAHLDWASASVTAANRPANGDDKTSVTSVTAGIAETGTILITPSPTQHTAHVLLPDNHIAIVPTAQIVATMEEAMAYARGQNGGQPPRAMNFISGPSRTADIAQTLVIGAHGPIRVHVIVVG